MKNCPYCGYELEDSARACRNCGRAVPYRPEEERSPADTEMNRPLDSFGDQQIDRGMLRHLEPQNKRTNAFAAASFGIGIAAVFLQIFIPFLSVLALTLGIIGRIQIRKEPEAYSGEGLALAGIILGAVITILYLIIFATGMYMMRTPEFRAYFEQMMRKYQ